ncbi:DUF4091 domain-containing protein, partial [Candidatus Calescamantes bacterium]|nr:DUF4091 domain-containing protein [Candidatus Calescamantes bacterium]
VPLNEWSHIAAVCDVENQKVALYLNSEIDQTAPLRVKEILPVGKTLSIGAHGGGPKFAGIMDEVRIYARALSEAEVKSRYEGKEIEDSQLCLYFDFNEGGGKIVHDKSGNKKDGVLIIGFTRIPPGVAKAKRLRVVSLTQEVFKIKEPLFGVAIESPMKKVLRNGENLGDRVSDIVSLSLARNEHEGIQLVVVPSGKKLRKLRIKIGEIQNPQTKTIFPPDCIRPYFVGYIRVAKGKDVGGGTHAEGYTFYGTDKTKKVEYLPDPLFLAGTTDVEENAVQPIWIDVFAPKELPPGVYKGNLSIGCGGMELSLKIEVNVWDFELPHTSSLHTHFSTASDRMADVLFSHRVSPGHVADMYLPALEEYHMYYYGKVAPHYLPPGRREFAELRTIIERRLKKYIELGGRQFLFELPVFGQVHPPISFPGGCQDGKGFKVPFPLEEEAYIKRYIKDYADFLRQKGLLDKTYVFLWDEPQPAATPKIKYLCKLVREAAPDLRILIAGGDSGGGITAQELFDTGLVDIWVVNVQNFAKNFKKWKERQRLGDEIWWYITFSPGPGSPYPTYAHIGPSHNLIEARLLLGAMSWKYNIPAMMHWWTCSWCGTFEKDENTTKCWWSNWSKKRSCAGDGILIYPGWDTVAFCYSPLPYREREIFSSIRLEAIRDGIEDYEYLVKLKKLKESTSKKLSRKRKEQIEKILAIPSDIVSSLRDYTKNPEVLYKWREKIADMIQELEKK